MRTEYEIYQRLMFDGAFRRKFICDRELTLRQYYPRYENAGVFAERAAMAGLEEEAYRRTAALQLTSSQVFPAGHRLVLAFCGNEFYEEVLRSYFDFETADANTGRPLEILEPFDGYVVAPLVLKVIEEWPGTNTWWLGGVLHYEWAVWQARRVTQGWPPLAYHPPLVDGASLVSASFDLKALLKEVTRLSRSSVGDDIFRWRIEPGPGAYHAAIFPRGGDVAEATLDTQSFLKIQQAVEGRACELTEDLQQVVSQVGLVLGTSFLCCSNEPTKFLDKAPDLSGVVEPQPH